jgi:aldehyde dehydrogenase (NAD(P)+)
MSDLFTSLSTPNGKTLEQPLGLFINNEWVKTEETFETINPTTGKPICSVYKASAKHVDQAVEAANIAFKSSEWSDLTGSQRGDIIYKMYEIIKRDAELIASIESLDNGKPYINECLAADLTESYEVFKYYAGWADKNTGQLIGSQVLGKNKIAYVEPKPLGAVGGIVPWNFPFMMMAWKIAPALATGCTVVMKSSEITPLSALWYGKVAIEAGLPKGVLNILSGYGADVGSAMVSHPKLAKIAFTGSTATGKRIMEGAGASNLKKVTLECGGKSPFLVFDDCDLDLAVEWAYWGIFYNKGEVCTSTSRFFVQDSIYDKFLESFVNLVNERAVATDPFDEKCTIGPLASSLQYEKVKKYVKLGTDEGAKLLTGEFIDGPGYFCKPFIFADCTDDMTIMKEEIFGPVVAITKFSTVDEAIDRANNTTYGLAAALFTNNITKAHSVASKLEAGMVFVNSNGDSDIHVPFGGSKMSGLGRELGSYALELFTEQKAVHINMTIPYK